MKRTLIMLSAALMSSAAIADYSSSVDSNGCWDAKDSYGAACMKRTDAKLVDGKATVRWENKCNHRIYAKTCNDQKNGNWDCGADGISAGGKKVWYTYNAAGQTYGVSIGSTKPSKDWVCADRVSNWNDK